MFPVCMVDDALKLMQDNFIVSECGWNSCCHFLIGKCKLRFLLIFMRKNCDKKASPLIKVCTSVSSDL
jgi:hypothetical protein